MRGGIMQIEKIVAIDVETSGLSKGNDVAANHQIVSIGLIVADRNFKELDSFYCEIKWNGESHWDSKAEKVHGLSLEHLEEHGLSEEDAAVEIAEFLLKHFTPESFLFFLGHNVKSFDLVFFNKLMHKFDIYFKIGHRAVDSFSVGFSCFGTDNSDATFKLFYDERKAHNSLEDARMALGVCRNVRVMMEELING